MGNDREAIIPLKSGEVPVCELPRRNGDAVMQTLKQMELRIVETQARMDGLVASLQTVYERLLLVEQSINFRRAATMGTGPTVK